MESKKKNCYVDYGFMDRIFSWSIEDILNEDLYMNRVEKIEQSFQSIDHYRGSYVYPLLEETRAQICSSMEVIHQQPYTEVIGLKEAKPLNNKLYNLTIHTWNNRYTHNRELYKTLPGDVFVLADYKPETVKDLQRFGRMWRFVSVIKTPDGFGGDSLSVYLKVRASENIDMKQLRHGSLFLIFLTNVIPNGRIWDALHMPGNLKLIKQILSTSNEVQECSSCDSVADALRYNHSYQRLLSELNESQNKAIFACLSGMICNHNNSAVKLIWGPPGTGKTKTLGRLLFALLKMKYRILVCAPTNVVIKEVASRVLSIVRESLGEDSGDLFCSIGDMLLIGNNERLKIGEDIEDIYLDNRVQELTKCFASYNGLSYCLKSMIDLLENSVSKYHIYLKDKLKKSMPTSFIKFLKKRFLSVELKLKSCISILCTHVAKSHLLELNYRILVRLNEELESFENLLLQNNLPFEELERLFSYPKLPEMIDEPFYGAVYQLYKKRNECLTSLVTVKDSFDRFSLIKSSNEDSIRKFCFQTSSLLFSTVSVSYKLHSLDIKPLNLLVIDEAAQLKECESIIPLLLNGISHVILVGDERQLPSMVRSHVSCEAGFGRSLFQRLSSLGHQNLLLNMQYRMHPQISSFPNSYFYFNKIQDAPNVETNDYGKKYLPGPMFGPYAFINIIGGKEKFDDAGRSLKNMAEVAVVMTILKNLHHAWLTSNEKLSIGIVSPYAAQVVAIERKLGMMYKDDDGFNVNVKSIDGFQGGEQDVIILSTVRTNTRSFLEFISSPQRTNVALTRARHCLWILGNERALTNTEGVWKAVVLDARKRNCFFNADEDKEMEKAILDAMKESDQFDDLLNTNSVVFKNALWKLYFSDKFLRSFKSLRSEERKKKVIDLLCRLSSGWRNKRFNVDLSCENSSQILKQHKVESLYVIWSTEIFIKASRYIQGLKIWDLLPIEDIPQVAKRLDNVFMRYTHEYISRCKEKGSEGNIEFPLSWPLSTNIQKFRSVDNNPNKGGLNADESTSIVENSKVEESILLMKYCSISRGYILYGHDSLEVDLPCELTEEQRNIIVCPQSTFVLGRSGTGKTTVLISKLIQNEKLHHIAVQELYGTNSYVKMEEESKEIASETEKPVLRQLFVTLSPGLCQKVQHHVSLLKMTLSKGGVCSSIHDDIGDTSTKFQNIPYCLNDISSNLYPLVVTFRKFLLMLDGTLENSYFERFFCLQSDLDLATLESVTMRKEVNYERFDSLYWPHFNTQLSKKLDSYQVFTEIMSHIKGDTEVAEHGWLSHDDYCTLSECRASRLSMNTREMIYDIFQNYEKMKLDNGEFDLADIVIDLHRRLRIKRYKGDEMHFVYIDEVQDLTMAQIALFKHICRNVEEGFVFCGDTAQTIGRGIDFRFQDVRSLFYKKFVLESKNWNNDKRKKVQISDIFVLSNNFCTNAEVLKLSQSVLELLFHFFPNSVDMLKVETSLIHGESPVVIESRNRENPILTTFGESGSNVVNVGRFGADKVILVRDDSARKEILHIVGKEAHVLTILECKGHEFQDVLLYNFFASSPLKRGWGILYSYMKEKHMLDSRTRINFRQNLDDSKHNVLCSELKQLYVALTRTRRKLLIYENAEEYCTPMFDYWKKKNLVLGLDRE